MSDPGKTKPNSGPTGLGVKASAGQSGGSNNSGTMSAGGGDIVGRDVKHVVEVDHVVAVEHVVEVHTATNQTVKANTGGMPPTVTVTGMARPEGVAADENKAAGVGTFAISATATLGGAGTVTADGQVIRRPNGPGPHRDSLIGKIVRKSTTRSFAIASAAATVGLISLVFLGAGSAVSWILLGCAGWGGVDAVLTLRRLAKGQYGDADYELREIAGPLVARIKKGGGPSDPDRLFPERAVEQPDLAAHAGQVTA